MRSQKLRNCDAKYTGEKYQFKICDDPGTGFDAADCFLGKIQTFQLKFCSQLFLREPAECLASRMFKPETLHRPSGR